MTDREPYLIDAHCHLDELARRGLPVATALERAHRAGVHQVVTSGDGLEDSLEGCRLAEAFDEVYFTVGWHPANGRPPSGPELDQIRQLLRHPRALAVGEVGLDYLSRPGRPAAPAELQRQLFAAMLELASEMGKPVVIHQREAHADLLEVLDRGPAVTGVLHCFSGDVEFATQAAARGLYCSFAGNVTFRSAAPLQAAARVVPAELLLVETDSPFMAPEPHRGRLAEPGMVRATAEWLAVLRGDCLESLSEVTSANTRAALGIPPA